MRFSVTSKTLGHRIGNRPDPVSRYILLCGSESDLFTEHRTPNISRLTPLPRSGVTDKELSYDMGSTMIPTVFLTGSSYNHFETVVPMTSVTGSVMSSGPTAVRFIRRIPFSTLTNKRLRDYRIV